MNVVINVVDVPFTIAYSCPLHPVVLVELFNCAKAKQRVGVPMANGPSIVAIGIIISDYVACSVRRSNGYEFNLNETETAKLLNHSIFISNRIK